MICDKCSINNLNNAKICIHCGSILPEPKAGKLSDIKKIPEITNESPSSGKKNKAPSLAKKAVNISSSIVKYVTSGMRQVEEEKRKERFDICVSCDRYNSENKTCLECGCYVEIKTRWPQESCPLQKWGAEEIKSKGGIILPRVSSEVKTCGGCGRKKT